MVTAAAAANAQPADPQLRFESVTIRPGTLPAWGQPWTSFPEDCSGCNPSFVFLLFQAYGLQPDQFTPAQNPPPKLPWAVGGGFGWLISPLSMDELSALVTNYVDCPVVDGTGLEGKYEIALTFSVPKFVGLPIPVDPTRAPPPMKQALRDQLGLVLEKTTRPADGLVVDQVEKKPSKR